MSVPDVLTVVGLLALFGGGIYWLPKEWRGEKSLPREPPAWWPFGGPLWRGWARLYPLAIVSIPFVIAAFVLARAVADDHQWADIAAAILSSVIFIGVGSVALLIVLFNKPKRLVVPGLRAQPGAVKEWRGADPSRQLSP